MTKIVKGAGRAAYIRNRRHDQRTPFPPREEEDRDQEGHPTKEKKT